MAHLIIVHRNDEETCQHEVSVGVFSGYARANDVISVYNYLTRVVAVRLRCALQSQELPRPGDAPGAFNTRRWPAPQTI